MDLVSFIALAGGFVLGLAVTTVLMDYIGDWLNG